MTTQLTAEQLAVCWCSGDGKVWATLMLMFALGVFVGGAGVVFFYWRDKKKER